MRSGWMRTSCKRLTGVLRRYVDADRLAGWSLLVSRRGKVAQLETYGSRDRDSGEPVEVDTMFRIYSMTKPITSVALMQLVERGQVALTDPIAKYLPAFADMRVFAGGSSVTRRDRAGHRADPGLAPAHPHRRVHLRLHVQPSGRRDVPCAGYEWSVPADLDLAGAVDAWAQLPLLFQPGAEWNYSLATDVWAASSRWPRARRLDDFFAEHIFGPLDMIDTEFASAADKAQRLATLYTPAPRRAGRFRCRRWAIVAYDPNWLSGGGGLISTLARLPPLHRRCCAAAASSAARGCSATRTVRYMTRNHLPGGVDLERSAGRSSPRRRSTVSASAWVSR